MENALKCHNRKNESGEMGHSHKRMTSDHMILWLVLFLSLLPLGCAAPVRDLWPPPTGAPSRTIYVSLDTWHAMIAFPQAVLEETPEPPLESMPRPPMGQAPRYEEWGYAEQAWYLEGRRGITGMVRALFWPTPGTVEVGLHDETWAARTPQPPSDLFAFRLSEEGYRRLRRHLRATIADPAPILVAGTTAFYLSQRSYHLFHNCHQYVAGALREAGLPLSTFWAFNRGSLAMQLRRATHMAEENEATGSGAR